MILNAKIPVYALEIIREEERGYITDTNAKILKSHLREEMQAIEDRRQQDAQKFGYQILPATPVLLGEIEVKIELPDGLLKGSLIK
jgi:hypothetical protein